MIMVRDIVVIEKNKPREKLVWHRRYHGVNKQMSFLRIYD